MSLTNITAAFLRKAGESPFALWWYDAHPIVHDAEWPVVCAALEEDGQEKWSLWVRRAVAIYGSTEDRAALRDDPDAWVRRAVASYGTAEDRAALRNDPNAWVREAVECYGRNDPK